MPGTIDDGFTAAAAMFIKEQALKVTLKPKPTHKMKCYFCLSSHIYLSTNTFWHKGKEIQRFVCYTCHAQVIPVFYCPECDVVHKHAGSWGSHSAHSCMAVPCKEHSQSTHHPSIECGACKGHFDEFEYSNGGVPFCIDCYEDTQKCSAPYCDVYIHPKQDGVVATPAATKLFCSDCSLVRTSPQNCPPGFHPLTWDYVSGCNCRACVHLAGKGPLWPEGAYPYTDAYCHHCDLPISQEYAEITEPFVVCHSCRGFLKLCKTCNESRPLHLYHKAKLPSDHPLTWACDICMEAAGLWFCDVQCQRWFPPTCPECPCGGVHSYKYTPKEFAFLTARHQRGVKREKTLFMGLELEVEAHAPGTSSRAKGAKLVKELGSRFCYVMHDGTLKGNNSDGTGGHHGFEIVTHPFTYDWFQENWNDITTLVETLQSNGYRSWEGGRCGIHIHVSRAPMTQAHQMKFILFVLGSANLMMAVGQRRYRDPKLHKYAPFHGEDRSQLIAKIRDFENPGVQGHYTALSSNKIATIEGRWFRGTLNPLGIRKNVEFMDSVWHFTKAFGFVSANEINYITWLRDAPQSSRYAVLLDYLENQYITRR